MSFKINSTTSLVITLGGRPVDNTGRTDDSMLVYDEVAGLWKHRPVINTLTTIERNAIAVPKVGQVIFNSDDGLPNFYDGNAWITSHTIAYIPIFTNTSNVFSFNITLSEFQIYGNIVKVRQFFSIQTISQASTLTSIIISPPPAPFEPIDECTGTVTISNQDYDNHDIGIVFDDNGTTIQWKSTISDPSYVKCTYQYKWK